MKNKHIHKEGVTVFSVLFLFFAAFLILPAVVLLLKAFSTEQGIGLGNFYDVLTENSILTALGNSFLVSAVSAIVTTLLAFLLSLTIQYTNVPAWFKKLIGGVARLPMLLPTITYGFAIIYSFGKQGLITKLLGFQLFDIYGFNGLLTGYIIYTLPVSFMLMQNAMQYIDKNYMVVSKLMKDGPVRMFSMTILRPLIGTMVTSFIQTFFLCFTDFGIPAAVGGEFETIAGVLYKEMLGSVPDFGRGAVVALCMLLPSVISIIVLHILEKYNIRYHKVTDVEMKKNYLRDGVLGVVSALVMICVLSIFAVIFVVPFVEEWPYRVAFTFEHVKDVFADSALVRVMKNSLITAVLTAVFGTFLAYAGAIAAARCKLPSMMKKLLDGFAMVTNTIPGMVLGLAYLFLFSGSSLQGTLVIMIICNIVHYYSTPYLMMKNALLKLNSSWETTAMLMGDKWIHTIIRIVTPNMLSTILEVCSYYFINAMVTISAVIFIAGARTMVVTTKIKELQYYNKFNEIFVLSLIILFINVVGKQLLNYLAKRNQRREIQNEEINEEIN